MTGDLHDSPEDASVDPPLHAPQVSAGGVVFRPPSEGPEGRTGAAGREATQEPPRPVPSPSAGRQPGEGDWRVCLIAKHAGRVWSLPKGRLDAHESAEEAAVREVLEETGHRARIVEHLGDIEYEFHWKSNNTHYHKIVTFFLMALVEENAQAPDHEADAVEWVPLQEACDRITHDNERAILLKARLRLRKISP